MNFKGIPIGLKDGTGALTSAGDKVEIKAGGADIWGKRDEFMFYCTEYDGDFTFVARLESFVQSDLYAKAGLMAREALDQKSPHVIFAAFSGNGKRNKNNGGYEFQYREKAGKKSFAVYPSDYLSEPPMFSADYPDVWLKMVRQGNTFVCYSGNDGKGWKLYSRCESALPKKVYVGLAVTSHNKKASTSAKFSNIIINNEGK